MPQAFSCSPIVTPYRIAHLCHRDRRSSSADIIQSNDSDATFEITDGSSVRGTQLPVSSQMVGIMATHTTLLSVAVIIVRFTPRLKKLSSDKASDRLLNGSGIRQPIYRCDSALITKCRYRIYGHDCMERFNY